MEGGPNQPKYKGIRLRKWGKWVSEVRLPNSRERIWLGSYDTAEKAARAFDAAQFCLRGPKAKFNFPNSPPDIDISGGQRLSPSEIQAVAARFANDYVHRESSGVQEIRQHNEGNMGNINSHVINMEEEEEETTSLSATCNDVQVVHQMGPTNSSSITTTTTAMDWAFSDMMDSYPYHASGPPPPSNLFCDPYSPAATATAGTNYDYGYYSGGLMDSLSSNLYSPPHFPQRTTPNYDDHDDDDDNGNGGDEHYSQPSYLWSF